MIDAVLVSGTKFTLASGGDVGNVQPRHCVDCREVQTLWRVLNVLNESVKIRYSDLMQLARVVSVLSRLRGNQGKDLLSFLSFKDDELSEEMSNDSKCRTRFHRGRGQREECY